MVKKNTADTHQATGPNSHGTIASGTTVDPDEVAFFAKIADTWWDPNGPFKPLHKLNPTRLNYIRSEAVRHFGLKAESLKPLAGLRVLDIGCGGGLVSEPLFRMGAELVSIDASERNIKTASVHAERGGLHIDYRNTTAEALVEAGQQFDLVVNMEVIEHVADVDAFLATCRSLTKPGGLMLVSTLNRTVSSFIKAIVGAEYVLRWLPVGAHDWKKFITPDEMTAYLEKAGFTPESKTGFSFAPFSGTWRLSDTDLSVNYAAAASVPKAS